MFKISPIRSASGAAKYFSCEDNYYLAEADAKEASLWWGEGALRLGLNGKVEEAALQNFLHGRLPNGVTIGLQKDGTINHRAGYDLCFSAPKSVSILVLDGGDKRLYKAHVEAVQETLKLIERDAAQAKIYNEENEKKISFENTKNLTIAMVGHTTSRKMDVQLHTHALVMNATQRSDNAWRALASSKTKTNDVINGFAERVYNNQTYYGLLYHTALANKVVKLGHEIEIVGQHGMWEIKGVPPAARDICSKRHAEISAKMEQLGFSSLKAADIVTLDTRDKKIKNVNLDILKNTWRVELASVGFSSAEYLEKIEKNKGGIATLDSTKITENAKVAVSDSIEHLSQYNLKLDYNKLVEKALEFSIGTTTHSDIVKALNAAIQNREIISLNKEESIFVTSKLIEDEKKLIDFVEKGKGSAQEINIKDRLINNLDTTKTSTAIAIKVLQSKDRLNLIEHNGAYDQEVIKAILDLAEGSSKTVRVLSPNRLMANDINQNIKREPNSLWQWLINLNKPEIGDSVAGFNFKYKQEIEKPFLSFMRDKHVIIVDAAQRLGNDDMSVIFSQTQKTNARVIFINNCNAKVGFTAGNAMQTLKDGGIASYSIENTTDKILPKLTELKEIKDDAKRMQQVAQAFALKDDDERSQTKVILGAKTQITPINAAIREELKNRGKLGRIEREISMLNPVTFSKTEATLAQKYEKDMVVRFYDKKQYKDWRVVDIHKDRNILVLTHDGEKQSWNPKNKNNAVQIFKSEKLRIAEGDKLAATANMHAFGIKNSNHFVVEKISHKQIKLFDGEKTRKIFLKNLENQHFDYNYATTLSKTSRRLAKHLIADIKAYALDKPTISELTSRSQESLIIFTNDVQTAQNRFGTIPIKLSATEVILEAGKIDRYVSNRTITELKKDIEVALFVLGNKDTSLETKAVDFAIEKITARNAGFTHKTLVIEALSYALKEQISAEGHNITHESIMNAIAEKRKAGELVIGKHFDDGTRWTTKEILDLEHSVINDLKHGKDKVVPFLQSDLAVKFIDDTLLTKDQKDACHMITTTKDQFVMVQGYAGTGKTTMFSQVQQMLDSSIKMLALAPTHRAVKELRSVGIESQTLQSFIVEQSKNRDQVDNKLIVVDEASMISNSDFARFLSLVKDSKIHVVFSGDTAQHIAIESGKPYAIAQKTVGLQTAYLREIVRQKNPIQKEVVGDVIRGDYKAAFEKVASLNPQNYIERTEKNDSNGFFAKLTSSIIEIDNNQLKKGNVTLEDRVAEDFLSRIKETRDQTVIIVHSNKDRIGITEKIRSGLKELGEIAKQGIQISCLISKGLTNAELKLVSSYHPGDVLKLGKNYYHVVEQDYLLKSVLLNDEVGKNKYFYPEKQADKYKVELYEHTKNELAVGDSIRLTKTDKKSERYANFKYQVKEVNGKFIILESKDTEKQITMDSTKLQDAHWDYAQTVTGYGIQGGSKTYVIDYEVSFRKNLAHQRSFYISVSRPTQHLTIYTDSKTKILNRILANTGDKLAALEVIGEIKSSNNNIVGEKNPERLNINNNKSNSEFIDAKEVERQLSNSVEFFVERLLGKPNQKLSSAHEWRYGNKGSLAIKMDGENCGIWYNHETGESGNLLTLLQKTTGLSFKESLKYALSSINGSDLLAKMDHVEINKNSSAAETKTSEYAKKLVGESVPIAGSIVEKYLKEIRGIVNPDSSDIRFHPNVFTGKDEEQKYLPAMLSIGRDKDGNIKCVQATYLDPKTANKADLAVNKRTYASPSGASVFLNKVSRGCQKDKISFIAEGTETGLSVKDAIKNSEVVVTLGKSNFLHLETESLGKTVVFCLDNDGTKIFTDKVIHQSAKRLIDAGKDVFIAIPNQINGAKTDFNDVARLSGILAVKTTLENSIQYQKWQDTIVGNLEKNNGVSADFRMTQLESKHEQSLHKNIESNKHNIQKNLIKSEKEIY